MRALVRVATVGRRASLDAPRGADPHSQYRYDRRSHTPLTATARDAYQSASATYLAYAQSYRDAKREEEDVVPAFARVLVNAE